MSDKPYLKIGRTYYPHKRKPTVTACEVKGASWRAWIEGLQCFFEYDSGHFSSKFKVVKISKQDFEALKNGDVSDTQIARKYG